MGYFNFFAFFYDSLFPAIGKFFGYLISFSNLTLNEFLRYLSGIAPITVTNIMTGELYTFGFSNGFLSIFSRAVLGTLPKLFLGSFAANTPLWALFLEFSIGFFFVYSLIKYFVSLL